MDLNKLFTRVSQLNFLRKCVVFSDGENVVYFEVWLWQEARCWNNSYGKAENSVIDKAIWVLIHCEYVYWKGKESEIVKKS